MRHSSHFVEEFDSRDGEGIGRMVSLTAIEPDPKQPRHSMGNLDELVASIRSKGVLEPILVRSLPADEVGASSSNVSLRIISGERRYRAAQEAGLSEVPVIEMEVSEQEALEIALVENLQRKDLTPFEEADGYQALAEIHDYTHEQIASAVSKSRTVVTESLSLLRISPRVRDISQALGIHSKSVLLEILKADSEEEMIALLEAVDSQGLSRDDLRKKFRQSQTKSGAQRKKPYVFKFKAPDKTYSLSLSFRQSMVEKEDLVRALEQILTDLRAGEISPA
ncbi:MAG: ParB/RepB/Spo0J family partition protein [Deltaproteobacteria bacterium]|nr:ParB/RepB/Spo0J family partition protein [Deltaproteobacteria bacterium]